MEMEGGGISHLAELRRRIEEGLFKLYGILLYSDADTTFIDFLKRAHDSLAVMSGEDVFLFWFEHFAQDSILLWPRGEEPADRAPHVSRTESLLMARTLGIPMRKIPCLVLCRTLESGVFVVYSFDNSWSSDHMAEHFKELFDHTREVLRDAGGKLDVEVADELDQRLTGLRVKKWVKRLTSRESARTLLQAIATGKGLGLPGKGI